MPITTKALSWFPSGAVGVTVTPGTGAWDSGSWVELGTLDAAAAVAALCYEKAVSDFSADVYEVDIGTGESGSEDVQATLRVYVAANAAGDELFTPALATGQLPSGRVAIRLRRSTADASQPRLRFSLATTTETDQRASGALLSRPSAADASVNAPGTAWANSSWVEIVDATDDDGYLVGIATSVLFRVQEEIDIGSGASGSETVLTTIRRGHDPTGAAVGGLYAQALPLPHLIAKGTRLSMRSRISTTATSARPLGLMMTGPEPVEVEFGTDDELTGNFIGVSWIRFALIEPDTTETDYYWSKVALPDPAGYPEDPGGYKEPRVLRMGRFRRALSDDRGEYQGASFAVELSDTDRLLRGLLAGTTTQYGFYNRPGAIFMIADADRRLLKIPRLVAKGFVRKAIPLPELKFRMEFQDFVTARFAGLNTQLQIPRRVLTSTDFPNCPTENLGLPVPIIYGEVSDQNLVSTTGDGKGIDDVTGLTATVVGAGGSATKRYAVTAMNDVYGNPIGRPHDDHRGETKAVYVTVSSAPEDEDISPSNYIELRWDDMGTNAVQYRIYGRYPTLVRLLDAADKDGTGWVYYDGKRPSGTAEFDSLKMDGIPPDVNSTGGATAATVDTGNGVVAPIYVGITDDLSDVGDDDPEEWHTWVVCGHAVTEILGWYVGGVAQNASTESASGPWLIPGNTGYNTRVGGSPATIYQDINSHRYTIIYGRRGTIADQAADGSQPLTINVKGIEDVGDGSGTLISDVPSQYQHFLENWGFQDYQTGLWLDPPTWDDTDDPLIDADSFAAVKDVWEDRIVGGCVGGGVIGANGEQATLREWIARFSLSCDDGNGFSRKLAFEITAIDDSDDVLTAAEAYTQTLHVLEGTLTIEPKMEAFFNTLPYAYGRRFADGTWATETSVADSTSIDNYLETKTSQTYDLWFIRSATIASTLMQHRLDLVKDPPYRVTFDTPLVGWNLELGDIITLSHFEGVGSPGWEDRPLRVRAIDVDIDNFKATIECEDAERVFAGSP